MRSRHRREPRWVCSVALTALAVLPLAGCSAGLKAQTNKEHTAINGLNARVGSVQVLNAYVVAATNGEGQLHFSLFNNSSAADTLTAVSSSGGQATLTMSSSSAGGSSSANASGLPATVQVPAGQLVGLQPGQGYYLLNTGSQQLVPARSMNVTLQFLNAGSKTLQLPIEPPPDTGTSG